MNFNVKFKALFSILSLSAMLSACASYTKKSEEIRRMIYDGAYDAALEKLDQSDLAKADRDKALYHMERGTILYLNGKYSLAVKDWAKASDRIEELYTVSVSRQAASLAVNESYADYEGESFERVLLPTFSALAYFANHEPEKAIVETRRTYQILNALNDKADGKNTYSRDAFAHYLSGLIYESKREWDAAIIEYRAALDEGQAMKSWATKLQLLPIAESLASVAELRNRKEILSSLKQNYSGLNWTKQSELARSGEVYVVYEAGKSPLKEPRDFVVPVQGSVIRISFPDFKDVSYFSRGATVIVDGKNVGRTVAMQDIGAIAKQALSDRRTRDLVRMAARVIAKDQASRAAGRALGPLAQLAASIFGAVTESADTRGWTSLPDSLQVLRVPIAAGKQTKILIQPDSGKPEEFVVQLKPGEKRLVRSRTFF